ncbi:MAG: flagellar biosynthesis protein FlgA [Deltaproteobacteria bacterium]|nr:MAG: flagellar biosynthesis protein FlgA [Deltaproteobacteria bacterium]
MKRLVFLIFLAILSAPPLYSARIKDIAKIYGVRNYRLIGYGLVTGLPGTGDKEQTVFSIQSLTNMLQRYGINVDPDKIRVRNIAAVMVTAEVPPFARPGMRIDAIVSSIGDAKSLQGGVLLLTPLRAIDGKVYAIAQGPVSIGGGFFAGGAGASVSKNITTTGRVINGVIIERRLPFELALRNKNSISILLNSPDFSTADNIAKVINESLGIDIAKAIDPTTVKVKVLERDNIVDFLAKIESLDVPVDVKAKVVINERTGTVVIGKDVKISTVAIAHGGLSIVVKETPKVSQPLPFSTGETIVTPETKIEITEEKKPLFLVPKTATISDLVKALNAIGGTPRDLIAILQAIKEAGALQAEIEVI